MTLPARFLFFGAVLGAAVGVLIGWRAQIWRVH